MTSPTRPEVQRPSDFRQTALLCLVLALTPGVALAGVLVVAQFLFPEPKALASSDLAPMLSSIMWPLVVLLMLAMLRHPLSGFLRSIAEGFRRADRFTMGAGNFSVSSERSSQSLIGTDVAPSQPLPGQKGSVLSPEKFLNERLGKSEEWQFARKVVGVVLEFKYQQGYYPAVSVLATSPNFNAVEAQEVPGTLRGLYNLGFIVFRWLPQQEKGPGSIGDPWVFAAPNAATIACGYNNRPEGIPQVIKDAGGSHFEDLLYKLIEDMDEEKPQPPAAKEKK